jgi:hypothetical protein
MLRVFGVFTGNLDIAQRVRKSGRSGIREMQFPDTGVTIPCSVRLKNRHCVVRTRVY